MTIRRKIKTSPEGVENLETVEQELEMTEVSETLDEVEVSEDPTPVEIETQELSFSVPEKSLTQQTENLRRRPEPLAKARPRRNLPKFSPKLK
jgi:hypothetical protein